MIWSALVMEKALLNGRSVSARRTHRRFRKLERLTPIDRTLVLKIGTGRAEDFSYRSHIFVTVLRGKEWLEDAVCELRLDSRFFGITDVPSNGGDSPVVPSWPHRRSFPGCMSVDCTTRGRSFTQREVKRRSLVGLGFGPDAVSYTHLTLPTICSV